MPRISSILVKNDSQDIFQKVGCCQFLHTTSEQYVGLVPLKYLYNHRGMSKRFEAWMDFLNNDLELDISYEIKEIEVSGWKSLKQYKEVYEKYSDMYMMGLPPAKTYAGVYARTSGGNYRLGKDNRSIVVGTYTAGSLMAPVKKDHPNEPNYLMDRDDLPKFNIPVAYTTLPTGLAPEHNGFKYIAWYMIRMYPIYQQVCNFILDSRPELEAIMKKYNLGWWNIISAILLIFNMSNFSCHTAQKILKADIESALEKDAKRYERDNAVRFNYTQHELYIAGAICRYCAQPQEDIRAMLPKYMSSDYWTEDNTSGQATSKEITKVLKDITNYYNLLTKKK